MREPQWVKRFTERGRPGAYLSVVKSGSVGAGDRVEVLSRPGHGVTIASWFTGADGAQADALEAAEADGSITLVHEIREGIDKLRSRRLLVLDK